MLGLQSVPEYTPYEAQPMAEQNVEETVEGADGAEDSIEPDSSETTDNIARVRVFDGEIQWYDGKYWVSAGKAADLIGGSFPGIRGERKCFRNAGGISTV